MRKLPDWAQRFEAAVKLAEAREFDWATHNCCTFSSELFEAVTGVDPIPNVKTATTKRQALSCLKKFGGGGILDALEKVAENYRLADVPPQFAKRCDPVLVEWDGVELAGTVSLSGRDVIALHPDRGITLLPIKAVKRAWSIS